MSNISKLQEILDLIVTEGMESGAADKLRHEYFISRAAKIYESIIAEEDFALEDNLDSEIDDHIGGDATDDFIDSISAAKDDIQSDELEDGKPAEGKSGDDSVDDRDYASIESISDQMATLMAEFQTFLGDEDESDDDAEDSKARISESSTLDVVPETGMEKEGKLVGTGKNSKIGKTEVSGVLSKAPAKPDDGVNAIDFTEGGEESGSATPKSTKGKVKDNADLEASVVAQDPRQTKDGEYVGTGYGIKSGAVNTNGVLSKAPKK